MHGDDASNRRLSTSQDCSDLDMRPCSATSRANISLLELCGNGIVAGRAASHDVIDDGPDIGGKSPRIRLYSLSAKLCDFGQVGIAPHRSSCLCFGNADFGQFVMIDIDVPTMHLAMTGDT